MVSPDLTQRTLDSYWVAVDSSESVPLPTLNMKNEVRRTSLGIVSALRIGVHTGSHMAAFVQDVSRPA